MTRLHCLNYHRLRYRYIIRQTLIWLATACVIAFVLYGAYAGIEYSSELRRDVVSLRADNVQAMAMMSGNRYVVDGAEYRLEEVKQRDLVRGM
jgi:hypothetical protein